MTLKEIKDKLEIGLKPDAPYRPTNLPDSEQDPADSRERSSDSADGHATTDETSMPTEQHSRRSPAKGR